MVYRLAFLAWVAALASRSCLPSECQAHMSPWALALQAAVLEWVVRKASVVALVVLAQAVYRSVQVLSAVCRLALVESPAVLVVVPGMWKRHNLGRMPGRV